jgi:Tfp pilus assembly protein PilE
VEHENKSEESLSNRELWLIDLIIIVAILGILAAIAIPRFREARNEALRIQLAADANSVVEPNSVDPNELAIP